MSESVVSKSVALLKNYGLTFNLTNSYTTSDYDGAMLLCDHPDRSAIPPKFVTVPDVDALKALTGQPDEVVHLLKEEALLPDPKSLGKIADPYHPHICTALQTYVYGNSKSVHAWKETINALRFPMEVAVYGAGDVTVTPNNPLVLEGTNDKPIAFICNTLTIEPGGHVTVKGPGTAAIQLMQTVGLSSAAVAADPTNWVCLGGDGGPGGKGGDSGDAGNGSKGTDATENGKSGCNAAGKGSKGGDAANATEGGKGGDGESPNEFNVNTDELNGVYVIGSVGGNGGPGGPGGNGGKGGDGGPGGNSCRDCGQGQQGDGGKGGDAGPGGPGGNGGNGTKVYINYKTGNASFNVSTLKANGGKGGDAGKAGGGGSGTVPGGSGATAKPGDGGKGGQPGQIFINGKKIGA
jgi:hypothetical protein